MKALYHRLAKYYNKIYFQKDYKKESAIIDKILKRHKIKTVLEVACGTGNYTKYLYQKYKILGLDINLEMLKIARNKIRGVRFIQGDMKTFKLNKKFDAILCMFSSISYNKNKAELKKTLKTFYNHLNSGGVVMFDTSTLKNGQKNYDDLKTYQDKDIIVARFSRDKKVGNNMRIYFYYLIVDKNKFIHDKDVHVLGLFSVKEIKDLLRKMGFVIKTYKIFKTNKSRILFVGVKK